MWKLASYFFSDFTIGKVIAMVALAITLTTALVLTIDNLAVGIATTLPAEVTAFAVTILPTNLSACISVIAVARITRWVYDWHITIAKSLTS